MAFKKTKRKDFKFYRSYYDVFNELEKDKDKLEFITALLDRQFLGIEPDLKGIVRFAYISQEYSISKQIKGWQDATNQELTGPYADSLEGCGVGPLQELELELELEVKVEVINIEFDKFWNLYDKKVGDKTKLQKKWENLKDDEREDVIKYIPRYIASKPDKQFRKDPSTFLNQRGWEDEIIGELKPQTKRIPNYGL